MTWIATAREPGKKEIEIKPQGGLTGLSKPERRQYDSAVKAAKQIVKDLDKDCLVSMSGDTDTPQVHVHVVVAE